MAHSQQQGVKKQLHFKRDLKSRNSLGSSTVEPAAARGSPQLRSAVFSAINRAECRIDHQLILFWHASPLRIIVSEDYHCKRGNKENHILPTSTKVLLLGPQRSSVLWIVPLAIKSQGKINDACESTASYHDNLYFKWNTGWRSPAFALEFRKDLSWYHPQKLESNCYTFILYYFSYYLDHKLLWRLSSMLSRLKHVCFCSARIKVCPPHCWKAYQFISTHASL